MSQIINITELPATVDWTTSRGSTLYREFNIKEGGALADLTGSTFSMVVSDNRGNPLDTLTLGDGITVVSTGRIRVHRALSVVYTWPSNCDVTFVFTWTRPTTPVIVKELLKGKI